MEEELELVIEVNKVTSQYLSPTTNPSESYEKLWTMLHVQLDEVCLGILNLEMVLSGFL